MKKTIVFLMLAIVYSSALSQNTKNMADNSNKLAVLWTSGDPEVAEKMGFMYTYNAKKQGWFDDVVLIIWGPSAKLLSENKMLQDYVKKMQDAGVIVEACTACANMYGVEDDLENMGIDVKGMGIPLSDYMKEGWQVLTL